MGLVAAKLVGGAAADLELAKAALPSALVSGRTRDADVYFDFRNDIYKAGGLTTFTFEDALAQISGVFTRPSNALRWVSGGVLTQRPADEPSLAFQIGPFVDQQGLLIERASYNALADSSALTSAGNSNATVATSNALGPDGVSLTMRTVTSSATSGYSQTPNTPIGAPFASQFWTWSVIVPKLATSQVGRLEGVATGGSGVVPWVNFNTLTGVVTSGSAAGDFGIVDLGRWWMPWVAQNINTNTTAQARFYPVHGGIGALDFGHPQVEPGHGPTSRIVTSGTAGIRRERDHVVIPASRLASSGAITITARPRGGSITRVIAQIDDGTENNRITVQRNASGNIEVVSVRNGVIIGTNSHGAHTAGSEVTVSVLWSGTSVWSQRNYAGLSVIAGALPASVRNLRLGANSAGLSVMDGAVAKLSIWWGQAAASQLYRAPTLDVLTNGDSMAAGAGVGTSAEQWATIVCTDLKRTRTNIAVGGTTSTQAKNTFLAQNADVRGQLQLLWTGHNNPSDPDQVMADIADIIGAMSNDPAKRRFIIGLPTQNLTNAVGSVGYNGILTIRQRIIETYPDNYIDLPGVMLAAAAALGDTAGSDSNIANGYTPARYLTDSIHLNAAGHIVVAAAWRAKILAMGY